MAGIATIMLKGLKGAQQPKIDDIKAYLAESLSGLAATGSAASGTVTITGRASDLADTAAMAKKIADTVPPTSNPLDQELSIPNISPAQFEWSFAPDDGAPVQTGGFVQNL